MTKLAAPYLHVTYCDDIRQEVGGKLTLVGVYNALLGVTEAPTALPQLCLHVAFAVPIDQTPGEVVITVFQDGAAVVKSTISDSTPTVGDESEATRRVLTALFRMAPFPIQGPSSVHVVAECGLGTFQSGGLKIQVAPAPPNS